MNNTTNNNSIKIKINASRYPNDFLKISSVILVASLLPLSYFFGFGIGMLLSVGIFLLIILAIVLKEVVRMVMKDGIDDFCKKYKFGVALFVFNVVFDAIIWIGYFLLSVRNQKLYTFHFTVLSGSLLVFSVWLVLHKYLSKKPFMTFSLWTFLNFIIILPFIFFIIIYIILKDLFGLF